MNNFSFKVSTLGLNTLYTVTIKITYATAEMQRSNQNCVIEFIFLDFSNYPELQLLATLRGFPGCLPDHSNDKRYKAIIVVVISMEDSLDVPMHLFLLNLSVVEVGLSSAFISETLLALSMENTVITFENCFAQMYFILLFDRTECFLLMVIAYD